MGNKRCTYVAACHQCKQPGTWLELDGYDQCPMCGATVKQISPIEAQRRWEATQNELKELEQHPKFKVIQREAKLLQKKTDQRLHLFRTINNDEVDEIWNSG